MCEIKKTHAHGATTVTSLILPNSILLQFKPSNKKNLNMEPYLWSRLLQRYSRAWLILHVSWAPLIIGYILTYYSLRFATKLKPSDKHAKQLWPVGVWTGDLIGCCDALSFYNFKTLEAWKFELLRFLSHSWGVWQACCLPAGSTVVITRERVGLVWINVVVGNACQSNSHMYDIIQSFQHNITF